VNTAPDAHPVRRHAPHLMVCFAGRSGSGKTTLAREVGKKIAAAGFSYPYLVSFAKPLKRILSPLDKTHPHFRQIAQNVGDYCRHIHEDCFVEDLIERIQGHEVPSVSLVDDCRRMNEASAADIVFKLTTSRPNALNVAEQLHVSETEWERVWATENFITDNESDIPAIVGRMVDVIKAYWEASE
jgi:adenylate kinase family enzyme